MASISTSTTKSMDVPLAVLAAAAGGGMEARVIVIKGTGDDLLDIMIMFASVLIASVC